MKRIGAFLLAFILMISIAAADSIDLSGMSFDELVALKDQINLAIWNSQEWQEVTVPQGIWKVGEDIPAGHWTIKPIAGQWADIIVGYELEDFGKSIKMSFAGDYYFGQVTSETSTTYNRETDLLEISIELPEGCYIQVKYADVIFTPYSGKKSFGFK